MFRHDSLCTRRVKRALARLGCVEYRSSGKHTMYITECGRRFPIALSHSQIAARTVRHSVEMAGIRWDDFTRHYK